MNCAWNDGWQVRQYPALKGACEADVIVVGGGLSGLSAAYHLARRDMKVVLLEAKTLGWGASGRNNGQVIPTFSRIEPDVAATMYGVKGDAFVRLVGDSGRYLFDLAQQEQIDCAQEPTGWVQPAHTPDRVALLERRAKIWERYGVEPRLLDAAATASLLGSEHWHGALLMPTGGHINPLKLVHGLAASAVQMGVEIFENSSAVAYQRQGGIWRFETPEGSVCATRALIATNAYSDAVNSEIGREFSRSMIPVGSWQMATEPVDVTIRQRVLPGRQAVSDTRVDLRFFRYDEFNRIVTGCFIFSDTRGEARALDHVRANLVETFPLLAGVRFTHIWSGNVGISADGAPHVFELGPGLWAWGGCNGRGVALSVSLGREFAALAQEGPAACALPLESPSSIPFHRLARKMAPWLLRYMRRRDKVPFIAT